MNVASSASDTEQPPEATRDYQQQGGNLAHTQQAGQPAEVRVVTRFLVCNVAAGVVIGRAGTNITQYQANTGARIQLSRSGEVFPGTNDRVMLLAGTLRQVSSALHMMLNKLVEEERRRTSVTAASSSSTESGDIVLRLLVPAALCGGIIGKKGATIRSFGEDSRAKITVSAQNKQPPGVPERVVRITGQLDVSGRTGLLRAVTLITTKMLESPNYSRVTRSSVSYGRPGGFVGGQNAGFDQEYRDRPELMEHPRGIFPNGDRRTVTIGIANSRVGAIIGEKGEVINQLKSLCNVEIRISNRDDFMQGTRDRKVTISGTAEGVSNAQALIRQKLNEAPAALAL